MSPTLPPVSGGSTTELADFPGRGRSPAAHRVARRAVRRPLRRQRAAAVPLRVPHRDRAWVGDPHRHRHHDPRAARAGRARDAGHRADRGSGPRATRDRRAHRAGRRHDDRGALQRRHRDLRRALVRRRLREVRDRRRAGGLGRPPRRLRSPGSGRGPARGVVVGVVPRGHAALRVGDRRVGLAGAVRRDRRAAAGVRGRAVVDAPPRPTRATGGLASRQGPHRPEPAAASWPTRRSSRSRR